MYDQVNPLKLIFNKVYSEEAMREKIFHLHVRHYGDWDELYFRDYLKEAKEIRQEYEEIKFTLSEDNNNRESYTKHRSKFIDEKTAQAREKYKDKYK
jgi:GrpB-like predicted nucleotidyltransferase (UPF0157 family)